MSSEILIIIGAVVVLVATILVVIGWRHSGDGGDPLQERLAEFATRERSTSLEEIELAQPFTDRVIIPILKRFGIKINRQDTKNQNAPEKGLLDSKKGFNISVSYPRLFSKRLEATILLQLFLAKEYARVRDNIQAEFRDQAIDQHTSQSELKKGATIRVRLFHPDFDFSDAVTKTIDHPLNRITFLGKPKDNCEPGLHKILVSILDAETEQELESFAFTVNVVDFVFDHISRPLLSRVSAIVLGIGSFAMFTLTLLNQIDKTVGLTSGAAASVLTLAISTNFYNVYQRIRPNTP